MVKSSDISVVIQGPVIWSQELTVRVVQSVRQHLIDSEIILSTWDDMVTDGISADLIIKSKLPDNFEIVSGLNFNGNRQIVSTIEGINVATRKYVLKLRSDTIIDDNVLIKYFDKYSRYLSSDRYKLFSEKILALRYYFRSPISSKFLFHISDILLFGRKEDIIGLFSSPLADKEDIVYFGNNYKIHYNAPEKYLWINFLKRKGFNVKIKDNNEVNLKNFLLSEMSILNNFIIFEPNKLFIKLPSRLYNNSPSTCYTYFFWNFYRKSNYLLQIIISTFRYFVFVRLKLVLRKCSVL